MIVDENESSRTEQVTSTKNLGKVDSAARNVAASDGVDSQKVQFAINKQRKKPLSRFLAERSDIGLHFSTAADVPRAIERRRWQVVI
jgi:hypothetical protein